MAVMTIPYELRIGWRYTRAGRTAGRNGFISFISGVSMLGIALGVAALIIVLSVMNGFQKEVRDRMLAVVSHIELTTPTGEGFADVNAVLKKVRQHPEVVAAAPFIAQQALLARGEDMRGALVRGIEPEQLAGNDGRAEGAVDARRMKAQRLGGLFGGEADAEHHFRAGDEGGQQLFAAGALRLTRGK